MYISTYAVVRSRHCGFQRDPEVSGLPQVEARCTAVPNEWALGSSGCGVTLGCERLFLLMEDFDQTSRKSGVSGCRWGEDRETI